MASLYHGPDCHGPDLVFLLFGVELRHEQYIVDDGKQMPPAGQDVFCVFDVFAMPERPEQLMCKHFGKADDRIERRAKFMAHTGDEQ